ncbi:MAG TPA: ATP-dependent Clp protease proteolytic subunit [Actinomycetota bacterium]|nr:ATP-dependent Clp protease proteolytic subunit [Actinomycetota bacterium]
MRPPGEPALLQAPGGWTGPDPDAGPAQPLGVVRLFKDIDDAEADRFCGTIWTTAQILAGRGGRITVFVNTGGGAVAAGFAMIEMLYKVKRDLAVPVETVVLGTAYSMGAAVVQAGDRRLMGYFSTMMLHSSTWQVSGRDREVFRDLKKLSDLYQRMLAELFHRRTGLRSQAWWRRFIYSGRERYLSARECLALNLVDEVCEFLDECYLPAR